MGDCEHNCDASTTTMDDVKYSEEDPADRLVPFCKLVEGYYNPSKYLAHL